MLNEADLVVVPVVDAENLVFDSEIQVMDDVIVDSDLQQNFVATSALKAKANLIKKHGYCGEKTIKHTKTTCPLNPTYIAKLARISVDEQAARIDANEQATRIDAAEQATNVS
ncbi:hypothetical protein Tco_0065029 [Tanacetum coccineum]